jgi:hypothetical protein
VEDSLVISTAQSVRGEFVYFTTVNYDPNTACWRRGFQPRVVSAFGLASTFGFGGVTGSAAARVSSSVMSRNKHYELNVRLNLDIKTKIWYPHLHEK